MADEMEVVVGKRSRNKSKSYEDRPEDIDDEEEPDFSDPENFVDDVNDDDLLGDLIKKKPSETDGIDSVVVVDNVPSVGDDRLDKLKNIIRKIFSKFGKFQTEHYPKGENNKTKGYIFIEYQNSSDAAEAVAATNGYRLDKQHTFIVNLLTDFDKYANVPDVWETPIMQPYKDHGNLRKWLQDQHCYDQYAMIYEGGEHTSVMLNSHAEPTVVEERKRWTETYVRWSPQGNYLATFHARGIALWGREEFVQIAKFTHSSVQLIDFSPCERYMVTFSPLPDHKDDQQAIIVWDILTGQKKRSFHCENASMWPIFKWNHDGRYLARLGLDTLSIYETPGFGLLEKKSIKIHGLKEFSWSPTDNIISYWTPEERDTPGRVTLIEVPSRTILNVKNLFTVCDCAMHWQKNGDYLCVKVDRYKSKKDEKDGQVKYGGIFHNFNVFRIREKQIPVDIVEVKESVSAFAWEPIGHKFAFIHGETPRISVSFYMVKKGGAVEIIKTLEKRQANALFWCPRGQFIVLAGLRSMSGVLEFWDTTDMTMMNSGEHFMATDVEWDPSGRYLSTAVSWWGHKVDNAYWIWNFQGKLQHKQQQQDRFCQLVWRPRPPTLLGPERLKEIKKNIKKYYPRFQLEDKMRESKASKEQIEKRRKLMSEFDGWKSHNLEEWEKEKDLRIALRGIDTDRVEGQTDDFTEETFEFLIKVEEKVIE